jgi:uncharacterized protein
MAATAGRTLAGTAWRRRTGAAAIVWIVCASCAAAPGGGGARDAGTTAPDAGGRDARRAEVRFPSGRLFVAEIADTPRRQQEGYMFRRQVGEDEGMVFVFPHADSHPFWMKNTLVPLDMIWMDDEFTVIYLQPSAPPCKADPCPNYGTLRVARYVLEVRGGTASGEGLKVGDRLQISFPQSAR